MDARRRGESSVRFDSTAPPVETTAKPASFREADIYATLQGIDALGGIGDILRPRRVAVSMSPACLHEGNRAEPPPRSIRGNQAAGSHVGAAGRSSQTHSGAREGASKEERRPYALNAGQLALRNL